MCLLHKYWTVRLHTLLRFSSFLLFIICLKLTRGPYLNTDAILDIISFGHNKPKIRIVNWLCNHSYFCIVYLACCSVACHEKGLIGLFVFPVIGHLYLLGHHGIGSVWRSWDNHRVFWLGFAIERGGGGALGACTASLSLAGCFHYVLIP